MLFAPPVELTARFLKDRHALRSVEGCSGVGGQVVGIARLGVGPGREEPPQQCRSVVEGKMEWGRAPGGTKRCPRYQETLDKCLIPTSNRLQEWSSSLL